MYLYGSFVTQLGETVTVHIVTENSRAVQVEIGGDGSGVDFPAESPVEIQTSVNDTFDHMLRSEATVRLLTRDFIPELFCKSPLDAVVNVFKSDRCVFAGYIQPQAYSQPYDETYDELEVTCVDALSVLENLNYGNVGASGVLYDDVRANAGQGTFAAVIGGILGGVSTSLDIVGNSGAKCYYDGSKSLTVDADRYGIFGQMSVSELLFLGEEEDDVWTQGEVLEALLKYLNLHIVQDGLTFYIFAWETIKKDGTAIAWKEVNDGTTKTTPQTSVTISTDNVAESGTTINIGEVYNQLLLTCKLQEVEQLIKSPLDSDSLTSPYTNKQLYLTEISSEGNGETGIDSFFDMIHNRPTTYKHATITDWYVRVRDNTEWTFPESGTGDDLIDKYCQNNANQHALPNLLPTKPCAALIALGKVEHKMDGKDNSPTAKVDMTDYLVVSVNGNGKDNALEAYPTEASLKAAVPSAVYSSAVSGGVLSPADPETTNYIVLSGRIVLNPLMAMSGTYKALYTGDEHPTLPPAFRAPLVPSRDSDGRWYTRKYYRADTPRTSAYWDTTTDYGLVPFTNKGPEQYEFKYSAIGDGTDTISKVGVLACMLIIGDKCAVETGHTGKVSDIVWQTYKTREQCADDDEYYAQSFTIGFDPKIGDKLVGTEFELQNNISHEMGIDAEGMAIPIRSTTKLSGAVRFIILGPVNTLWDEISRRHPTFFRHTKWSSTSVPLLAHVSSIFVKDFRVKVYSDNGLIDNTEDNDIVYMSDTAEDFVNRKDDIEFTVNSALTVAERRVLGVGDSLSLSTALNTSTGVGVVSVYDHNTQQQAKPEQMYVDSYYTEYHKPRIVMTVKLDDKATVVDMFYHYKHPAMPDKKFYVQSISRSLIDGYAELTLKEVWND